MRATRSARAVAWGVAFAALAHAGLTLALECGPPRLRDPEFGRRLAALHRRQREHPGRPLWVALGSSRMAMALRPAELAGDARAPLVFNAALVGSGPARERLVLERLLAAGARPCRLLVEVWPAFAVPDEADRIDPNRLNRADVAALGPLACQPTRLAGAWAAARLTPWFSHRHLLLGQAAPDWLPLARRQDMIEWATDGWGWLRPLPVADAAAHRPAFLAATRGQLGPRLAAPDLIHPAADAALRGVIARGRDAGAAVTLVWLPEASEFRSWYPPAARAAVADWLARLTREEGVGLIDARDWADDAELLDGVHLTAAGAAAFTRRFGRLGVTP